VSNEAKIGFDVRFNPLRIEVEHWDLDEGCTLREQRRIEYIDLQDKAVRDALIALGWTPPKEST